MALGIHAQEKVLFVPSGTYGNGSTLTSENTTLILGKDHPTKNYTMKEHATMAYCNELFGQTTLIEGTEKTRVFGVYGTNNPKDGDSFNSDGTNKGSGYKPASANLPKTGTFYKITTKKDGHICAFIVVNADKSLYVVKGSNGSCLPVSDLTIKADGNEPTVVALNKDYKTAEKVTGTLEFDAKANETYYVFCTGSKLTFGGYVFTEKHYKGADAKYDINSDGFIDVVDVMQFVQLVLRDSDTKYDINGDGSIDVVDVMQLVQVVLKY